jgi:hypothetical protein
MAGIESWQKSAKKGGSAFWTEDMTIWGGLEHLF